MLHVRMADAGENSAIMPPVPVAIVSTRWLMDFLDRRDLVTGAVSHWEAYTFMSETRGEEGKWL